jgi:tetratricopeptide (TPR) repeat protein
MRKNILLSAAFFLLGTTAFGQSTKNTMLYIIDSIPNWQSQRSWNPVLKDDIADMRTITGKDTLEQSGYGDYKGVTYIFTKEYRKRPDSLKSILSLKQMEFINDAWHWHGMPYYGKFINYSNDGKIMNEGVLFEGRLNGGLKTYFRNGNIKTVANYEDGILDGVSNDYYSNGTLLKTTEFVKGKEKPVRKTYFINGQLQSEIKPKQDSRYDTLFIYYSTGKIKQIRLMKKGEVILTKKQEDTHYYGGMFYKNLYLRNMRLANKFYMELLMLDSTNIDTYFSGGMLMLEESRFDRAIAEFDKVLALEPMMKEALLNRALGRIKKHLPLKAKEMQGNSHINFTVEEIATIPIDEQEKICKDLLQAGYLDDNETVVRKKIPEAILKYCRQGNGQ